MHPLSAFDLNTEETSDAWQLHLSFGLITKTFLPQAFLRCTRKGKTILAAHTCPHCQKFKQSDEDECPKCNWERYNVDSVHDSYEDFLAWEAKEHPDG